LFNINKRSTWIVWACIWMALPLLAFDKGGVIEVNRQRQSCGMIPLKNSYALSRSAYHHARYLGRLRRKGHAERPGNAYFTGRTPFERMVRAGFPSRAGVENISYGDTSYSESVRVLMSTIYHRLAFLDFRIDTMGSSEYGNRRGRIYVYDMASSPVAGLCRNSGKAARGRYIYGLCADRKKKIPLGALKRAFDSVRRRNAKIVLYPPPGARNVPRRFVRETPDPIPKIYDAGLPVTVRLNPFYYRHAGRVSFRLRESGGAEVPSKLLRADNDPHRKLSGGDFVLIPLKTLKPDTEYRADFEAEADGKRLRKSWSFRTGRRK